jgi:hypothetical protein
MPDKLSREAKSLIASYMFKLCIPSGIALTIISGLGGFLLKEFAENKAYTDAYTKAFSESAKSVIETALSAAAASNQAKINAQEAEASSKTAKGRAAEAEEAAHQLTTLINAADERVKRVIEQTRVDVNKIAGDPGFQKAVADIVPRVLIGAGIVDVTVTTKDITFSNFGKLEFVAKKSTFGKYEVSFTAALAKRPMFIVGATQRAVEAFITRQARQGFEVETLSRSFATMERLGALVPVESGFWFLVIEGSP